MIFNFSNIYTTYKSCRKNKRNTINQLEFEVDLLQNLWNLQSDLSTNKYKIGKSLCFLTTSPKLREVFASNFRDRVVHHIVVQHLDSLYEKKFISDLYNNRKNKGTHLAVLKAQKYMQDSQYFLQLDIKGFFYNLDKNILFKQLFKDIYNSDLLYKQKILNLCNKIIYHKPYKNYIFKGDESKLKLLPSHKTLFKIPPHLGLPIGNLTSQFFANVYLNSFDNFIKRVLKVKKYIRYVDDFVLFSKSRTELVNIKKEIEVFLYNNLGLRLREDSKLKKHKEGLDFLGYIIRPRYILVRRRVVNNYKYKKAIYLKEYEKSLGKMPLKNIKNFLSVQASFRSHLKHANSFRLNKKVGDIDEINPFNYDRV